MHAIGNIQRLWRNARGAMRALNQRQHVLIEWVIFIIESIRNTHAFWLKAVWEFDGQYASALQENALVA